MSAMGDVEVLRAACCVAGADKVIDPKELEFLQSLADKVGVGMASLNAMIEMATCDDNFCAQQFRILTVDPHEAMEVLIRMGDADGKLNKDEASVLQVFAKRLGLNGEDCKKIIEKVRAG